MSVQHSELDESLERYFKEKHWLVEIRKMFVSTKILMWNSSETKACMLSKHFIPTFSKPTYTFSDGWKWVLFWYFALPNCSVNIRKSKLKWNLRKIKVLVDSWEFHQPHSLFIMGSENSALAYSRQPQTEKIWVKPENHFLPGCHKPLSWIVVSFSVI